MMIRNLVRATAAALVVALPAACSAGEDSQAAPQPPASNVAIVVGAHANAPTPELSPLVLDRLRAAVEGQRTVSVVANAGQPVVVEQADIDLGCANPDACQVAVDNVLAGVRRVVGTVPANGPESDLLAAMALAADTIRDRPGGATVIVIDSGLSTAGALRFQEAGVLDAEPAELADYLAERGELPDLTGMSVVLHGIGDVAPPQEQLRQPQRVNLREIWKAVASKAGAGEVQVWSEPLTGPPASGRPPVTVVPVGAAGSLGCFGTLRSADVAFRPDLATLVDPAAARAALTPMARCLADLGRPVRVTGTTASAGTEEGRRRLSEDRAAAVADLLVELGVPAGLITTRGLGYQVPPCVPDRDPNGVLLPDLAAQNRQVIVEPAP